MSAPTQKFPHSSTFQHIADVLPTCRQHSQLRQWMKIEFWWKAVGVCRECLQLPLLTMPQASCPELRQEDLRRISWFAFVPTRALGRVSLLIHWGTGGAVGPTTRQAVQYQRFPPIIGRARVSCRSGGKGPTQALIVLYEGRGCCWRLCGTRSPPGRDTKGQGIIDAMDPNRIVVNGQRIGMAIIQTISLLHGHLQHHDARSIAKAENPWTQLVWYQLVMSGEAAMILSCDNIHPTTWGCIYQGCVWVEPSSRNIGRYPIRRQYVICIASLGVFATPTGIGLMSCTSTNRDSSFPRQIFAPVLARRFACMASHQTLASLFNNPTIQKTLWIQTTVSKWKAAATSARDDIPSILLIEWCEREFLAHGA